MVIIHTVHLFKEYNSMFFSKSHSCAVITTVSSLHQKELHFVMFSSLFLHVAGFSLQVFCSRFLCLYS